MLEKIKELCKEKGMSVSQLEQSLGFGNKAIYKWDEEQAVAFRHEVEHIRNGDFYSEEDVAEKERRIPF